MSVLSGCTITDVNAVCALQNYVSDVTFECFMGTINTQLFARIFAISWAALSTLKCTISICALRDKNVKQNAINSSQTTNLFLWVMGGLTTLLTSLSKNNPGWIREFWNDEISHCKHAQLSRSNQILSTPNPDCMANPSWNIIDSLNITCCYSQKLEQQWKGTHTPLLPVILAVAGLAVTTLMIVGNCVMRRISFETETEPLNRPHVTQQSSSYGRILKVTLFVMDLLLLGLTLGTSITPFRYNYCQPAWVNQDLNTCICSAPHS